MDKFKEWKTRDSSGLQQEEEIESTVYCYLDHQNRPIMTFDSRSLDHQKLF